MAVLDILTKSGAKGSTKITLPERFEQKPTSLVLLKQVYDSYLNNQRGRYAQTLTRAGVRGGGKKPWRQKGTGRARAGTNRSPLWRGGGIMFGPTEERTYNKRVSTGAKKQALTQALALAYQSGRLQVIQSFEATGEKTKQLASFLDGLNADGSYVLITAVPNPMLGRIARNIPDVCVRTAAQLTVVDVLHNNTCLFEKSALEVVNERTAGAAK